MHKRPVAWAHAGGPQDPRGHGRPAPALLPGPAGDGRPAHRPRSPPSGWPSSRASTRPRSARTSPTWAPTAPGASGYDVEFLLHQISRELGLTQDWPVVIVGVGNLGHALANYRGFGARGFRVVALVDADPAKVGTRSAIWRSSRSTTCPRSSPSATIAIGIIATPAGAAQEVADRLVDAGVTLDPELRPRRSSRSPTACRCARSTSRSSCRSCPSTSSARRRTATAGRRGPRPAPGRRRHERAPVARAATRSTS